MPVSTPPSEPLIPIRQMIRACRAFPKYLKFADSTGVELSGARTLLGCLVFRRIFRRLLASDEQNVGLLMPTSSYGALANLALSLDCRTTVNLNYTFSLDTINYCIRQADIKHVVTSRRVLERFPNLKLDAEILVMEELGKQVSLADKISAFTDTYITPLPLLEWKLGLSRIKLDDTVTIIFTSGSTGTPKGAMITHRGIAANVHAFREILTLQPGEAVLSALPLFHAFGYTVTFWLPAMGKGFAGVYHFNPLEPKKVGEMARKYRCIAVPSTPTFLRNLLRRCPKEDFEHCPIVIGGAEKLPRDLIEAWDEKFGHRPVEGFGTTELSPVLCVNITKGRNPDWQAWNREGTVGRPFPGLEARIVDPETDDRVLPTDTPGMLQVKGPSVMKGYYKEPEKTAAVLKNGWYTTGDIATIDKDGFIKITGRQSRISKIGGEMVPHLLIEETIDRIIKAASLASDAEHEGACVAISAVPDERKGERIIVLHTAIPLTPDDICKALHKEGLPNLWIPLAVDFHQVESIPLLGTGKLDLRAVKELAEKVAYGEGV